jgi:hypothetical protein
VREDISPFAYRPIVRGVIFPYGRLKCSSTFDFHEELCFSFEEGLESYIDTKFGAKSFPSLFRPLCIVAGSGPLEEHYAHN